MINIRKLEAALWDAADTLRSNSKLTSNQYCMPVLGLIFLRFATSRFRSVEKILLQNRPTRKGVILAVDPSEYKSKGAIYLPKGARYDELVELPVDVAAANKNDAQQRPVRSLGEAVNNAMALIEDSNEQLKGVLPRTYSDFSDAILAELLRLFNDAAFDDPKEDVFGRIYEYFLNKFAKNIAQDDGVFFTPKSLVKMIVNVLEPIQGVLLDPACGSGGMFVQSGDFVRAAGEDANRTMMFYGQEKVEYNAQLCLMNLAVHGLSGAVKSGDAANTFYNDAHELEGRCDYVMANPPFNVDKVKAEACANAGRLPFGLPGVNPQKEIGNANYLWISYFYAYLNERGRAGFVMASSATDSQGKDKAIREQLVKTGSVDVMISVGNNFFYTKSLPCALWFFDKGKPEELKDKVLFIDARNYITVVDRTHNEWSERQLKNLAAIVWLYRGEIDKYQMLLEEYRDDLQCDDFDAELRRREKTIEALREEGKASVAAAAKRERKKIQAEWDARIAEEEENLQIAKDAAWLYDKFGEGEFRDAPGLCKIATRAEIEAKGFSLTPGAYVGVEAAQDDGVDFQARMREIRDELLNLQKESDRLMQTIADDLEEMGI